MHQSTLFCPKKKLARVFSGGPVYWLALLILPLYCCFREISLVPWDSMYIVDAGQQRSRRKGQMIPLRGGI